MVTGNGFEDGENFSQIAISLFRDTQTGEWFAERVEFNLPGSRTRTSFNVPQPLKQAFTPGFVAELMPFLPTSHERGLLADGEVNIAISHLSLVGVRVATQAVFNGIQKVWVRFQRAFGAVQAMLQPQHRTERAAETALHYVAASALLDLVLPCLDMLRLDGAATDSKEGAERVAARLATLQGKKHDLEFYTGLLTRYLAQPHEEPQASKRGIADDAPSALQGFRLPRPLIVR
ncbi:hypothetical protein FHY55_05545 [Oceanicola sp. D3]|uniref:hypothetical protein n=1 Tax=Oceanicola sp. D3 TaxID=2587163 RepID=UPI001123D312|nr:hypothetical protein [Oceanicola sp. D3]QDC08734.1 hypothetical protein FHY55_05545 [Oceanicola sp. D3]